MVATATASLEWKQLVPTGGMKFTGKYSGIFFFASASVRHKNYIIQAQVHYKVSMPIACAMSA